MTEAGKLAGIWLSQPGRHPRHGAQKARDRLDREFSNRNGKFLFAWLLALPVIVFVVIMLAGIHIGKR